MRLQNVLFAGASLASLALGASLPPRAADASSTDGFGGGFLDANCKDYTFHVNGQAMNRNFSTVNLADLPTLLLQLQSDLFPQILVEGGQTLVGTYCKPTVKNANNEKIQILFHSITGNRDAWSALGGTGNGFPQYNPDQYSWVRYFNREGYATLQIDRLGNGQSAHPDPILVVQGPYETALYHDLIQQVRKGTAGLPKTYGTVFWVSNSYGSELGAASASRYPDDIDAYVLTGFSKAVQPDLPGILLGNALPAAVVMPARFGTLAPGYLAQASRQGHINSFFGLHSVVDFTDTVANLFFDREDVVSVGQFLSVYIGSPEAPAYKGRVLVLTGENDQAFCGLGSPVLSPDPMCGPLLEEAGSLFPAADYNWRSVARTGHGITFHLTTKTTYGIAKQFLAGQSFRGGPPA